MKFPGRLFSKKVAGIENQIPGNAADKRISAVYSVHQQPGQPTKYLKELGLNAVTQAFDIDLK